MTDAPKGALSHRGHEPGLSDASKETPKQSRPFLEVLFAKISAKLEDNNGYKMRSHDDF